MALVVSLAMGIWAATEVTNASKESEVKTLRYVNSGIALGIMAAAILVTFVKHSTATGGLGGSLLIVVIAVLLVRVAPPPPLPPAPPSVDRLGPSRMDGSLTMIRDISRLSLLFTRWRTSRIHPTTLAEEAKRPFICSSVYQSVFWNLSCHGPLIDLALDGHRWLVSVAYVSRNLVELYQVKGITGPGSYPMNADQSKSRNPSSPHV
jgi:hypothetical protein